MIPLGISYNDNYLISTDFDRSYNVYVIDLVRANKNWDQIQVVAQITDSMANSALISKDFNFLYLLEPTIKMVSIYDISNYYQWNSNYPYLITSYRKVAFISGYSI